VIALDLVIDLDFDLDFDLDPEPHLQVRPVHPL